MNLNPFKCSRTLFLWKLYQVGYMTIHKDIIFGIGFNTLLEKRESF